MAQRMIMNPPARTDRDLLESFTSDRDPEAFSLLVRRHGPMVLGVCRRILRNTADADDAFQATFLTLLRKGHTIRLKVALPNWLYCVAVRMSLRMRSKAQKQAVPVPCPDVLAANNPSEEVAWREAAEVLDSELYNLPEKYRSPLILCCIEGRSYEIRAHAHECA